MTVEEKLILDKMDARFEDAMKMLDEKKQKYLHDPETVKLFEDIERVERKKYKLQRDMYLLACEMCDEYEEDEDDST